METKLSLESETVEALQNLIQTNLDSAKCLGEASESIDHQAMTSFFRTIAERREQNAKELGAFVAINKEAPEQSGTLGGDTRKLWIRFRSAINGGDPKVVLIEAERAEDVIKGEYEDLLVKTAGSAMNDVLMRQMREVKKHHDQVRDLRDAA